ncbi:MAG: hypothetical protein H7138_05765, partial [Myxococcales bacterium]|nr:hypothetical protein [Myxococcales bacterium]
MFAILRMLRRCAWRGDSRVAVIRGRGDSRRATIHVAQRFTSRDDSRRATIHVARRFTSRDDSRVGSARGATTTATKREPSHDHDRQAEADPGRAAACAGVEAGLIESVAFDSAERVESDAGVEWWTPDSAVVQDACVVGTAAAAAAAAWTCIATATAARTC